MENEGNDETKDDCRPVQQCGKKNAVDRYGEHSVKGGLEWKGKAFGLGLVGVSGGDVPCPP